MCVSIVSCHQLKRAYAMLMLYVFMFYDSGSVCNIEKDPCIGSLCKHGSCRSVDDDYICDCLDGFTGKIHVENNNAWFIHINTICRLQRFATDKLCWCGEVMHFIIFYIIGLRIYLLKLNRISLLEQIPMAIAIK